MCSNYEPVLDCHDLKAYFNVEDALPPDLKTHTWPAYEAPFIRKHEHADVGDEAVPFRELLPGTFGMIPQWADLKLARNTYNARSETVAQKSSFRDVWKWGKQCIIPANVIYEPDYSSGKPIFTPIVRVDNALWGSPAFGPACRMAVCYTASRC
jgi:putative SOS response-associated peptidase YedK